MKTLLKTAQVGRHEEEAKPSWWQKNKGKVYGGLAAGAALGGGLYAHNKLKGSSPKKSTSDIMERADHHSDLADKSLDVLEGSDDLDVRNSALDSVREHSDKAFESTMEYMKS